MRKKHASQYANFGSLQIENKELAQIERLIDNNNYTEIEYIVYNLYGLTQDEINYINSL